MNNVLWLILGLVFSAALLMYARSYRARGEKKVLAIALVIAAIIYVVFAFIWGNTTWVLIEVIGIPLYGIFAWAAIRYSVYWLSIGWLLHPIWDVGLHLLGPGNFVAPEWYTIGCITFDILVAMYVLFRATYWKQEIQRYNKALNSDAVKSTAPVS